MSRTASWAWERSDVLLIEADGKALFAEHGIPVPAGVARDRCRAAAAGQRPVDGEGPGAGRRPRQGRRHRPLCISSAEVEAAVAGMLGSRLKGHDVDACLVEAAAVGQERYLAVMVDAGQLWPAGDLLRPGWRRDRAVRAQPKVGYAHRIPAPSPRRWPNCSLNEPDAWRCTGCRDRQGAGNDMLLERELALAEINPLFVSPSGCVAGDAKVVIDLNAIDRQPRIAAMIAARPRNLRRCVPQDRRRVRLRRTRSRTVKSGWSPPAPACR